MYQRLFGDRIQNQQWSSWPGLRRTLCFASTCLSQIETRLSVFTPKSAQFQISPAASPDKNTSHSMENLVVHSLLTWKMNILPILTISLIHFSLGRLGECTFWTREWKAQRRLIWIVQYRILRPQREPEVDMKDCALCHWVAQRANLVDFCFYCIAGTLQRRSF